MIQTFKHAQLGDVLYALDDEGKIIDFIVEEITGRDGGKRINYTGVITIGNNPEEVWFKAEECYPSAEALIKSKIAYWEEELDKCRR